MAGVGRYRDLFFRKTALDQKPATFSPIDPWLREEMETESVSYHTYSIKPPSKSLKDTRSESFQTHPDSRRVERPNSTFTPYSTYFISLLITVTQ